MTAEHAIGRYQIRDELGEGGMGTVYLAYDPTIGREVAIKVLQPSLFSRDHDFWARFEREVRTIAALEHSNIVSLYDFGEDGEWLYFVMRYMKGGTLGDKLVHGPLSLDETSQILERIGSVLEKAHSLGIVHRDLKPGNILFDEEGNAFLSDFGIVKTDEPDGLKTRSEQSLGTPQYMSPEQLDRKKIDGRSDIYSLGIILYEMLTGARPFDHPTSTARVMVMHLTKPVPSLTEVNPTLPPALDPIIQKATAKEPQERYATTTEMISALKRAIQTPPAPSPTISVPETRANEPKRETAVPARSTIMTKDAMSNSPKREPTTTAENKESSRSNAVPVPRHEPFNWRDFLGKNTMQIGMIVVFFGIWLLFILAEPDIFLSSRIYTSIMWTAPFIAIMALPLTMLIISREIDLSFPSIMIIGMAIFVLIFIPTGDVLLATIGALIAGVISGLLNGGLVVGIGVPSLLATIGTQFFLSALALELLESRGLNQLISLREAESSFIYALFVGRTIGSIPNQFWWSIGIVILFWVILNRTRFGEHIYLIGDKEKGAGMAGVNVKRTRLTLFILMGLTSAFVGVLVSLQLSNFFPFLGEGYLPPTLAAVFLGGTSIFGGAGSIVGTFLGSYIIVAINEGLRAFGLDGFSTELYYGFILIVSISINVIIQRRIKK